MGRARPESKTSINLPGAATPDTSSPTSTSIKIQLRALKKRRLSILATIENEGIVTAYEVWRCKLALEPIIAAMTSQGKLADTSVDFTADFKQQDDTLEQLEHCLDLQTEVGSEIDPVNSKYKEVVFRLKWSVGLSHHPKRHQAQAASPWNHSPESSTKGQLAF